MTATTAPQFTTESITAAVRAVAATCTAPTLVTLTAAATAVTGRVEAWPGGVPAPDAMGPTLAGIARLIARHRALFSGDVVAYAVILPGQRDAYAADRNGSFHFIAVPDASDSTPTTCSARSATDSPP